MRFIKVATTDTETLPSPTTLFSRCFTTHDREKYAGLAKGDCIQTYTFLYRTNDRGNRELKNLKKNLTIESKFELPNQTCRNRAFF